MPFQEHYPAWRQALAGGGWRGSGEELPAAATAWLLHQGSLTEKLRGRCGSLKVRIVRQGWFSGSLKTNEVRFSEAKTTGCSEAKTIRPAKNRLARHQTVLSFSGCLFGASARRHFSNP